MRQGPAPSTRAASNGSDRQRLQPGEQNQEHQRRPLPNIESDEAEERPASGGPRICTGSPPIASEKRGQHAGVAGVDQPEDDGDHDRRDHHRHDQHGAQQPDAAELAQAEERQRESEHRLYRDGEGDEAHGHPERVEELVVAPELDVVVEADIAQRFAIAVELGAGAQAVPERVDENGERDEDARRKQQVGQGQIEPRPLQPLAAYRIAPTSLTRSSPPASGRP